MPLLGVATPPHHSNSDYRYNDHSKAQPLGNGPWPLQTKHHVKQVLPERDILGLAMSPQGFVDASRSGDHGWISETRPPGDSDSENGHDEK
jgi:hypothetical protein